MATELVDRLTRSVLRSTTTFSWTNSSESSIPQLSNFVERFDCDSLVHHEKPGKSQAGHEGKEMIAVFQRKG